MSFPQTIRRPELLERTAEEWRRLIDRIEEYPLRCRIASIVFWDYFHDSDVFTDLIDDGIRYDSLVISDDRLAVELIRLGYPAEAMDARLKKADNEAWRAARTMEMESLEKIRKGAQA